MNAVEAEAATAIAGEYENVLCDSVTGKQAESVQIDGSDVLGNLDFDPSTVEIIMGGSDEHVTGVFYAVKQQAFPDGKFPRPFNSELRCVVNGQERRYQVVKLNGDKDNRAQLAIGLGAFTNRK